MRRVDKTRSRDTLQVRQTELFLRAFDAAYPQLDEILAAARTDAVVESPLFGARLVQTAPISGPITRLQVRPTYSQYRTLQELAKSRDESLAGLVRVVLNWYLDHLDSVDRASADRRVQALKERKAAGAAVPDAPDSV